LKTMKKMFTITSLSSGSRRCISSKFEAQNKSKILIDIHGTDYSNSKSEGWGRKDNNGN
jgi:hypothetical protein